MSILKFKLKRFFSEQRATLLGCGPMSKNCVDAVIELANKHSIPLCLIASRRQIESSVLGNGYCNNWSTEKFSEYINNKDIHSNVIMARDHGGPWQNTLDVKNKLTLRNAMSNAKLSFKADIDAGFEILHLDPSVDIHKNLTEDEILERLFELYEYCYSYASKNNKNILFEVGTEEQVINSVNPNAFENLLAKIFKNCKQLHLPNPDFVVVQTGTKVMETKNIGYFDSPIRVPNTLPAMIQVPKVVDICKKYNIYMKQHNTDYLKDESLKWHPKLGIHSANVAPEFGVAESQALVNLLKETKLDKELDTFLKIAYNSKKWEKWVLPNSSTSDLEKAILAGHYIFSSMGFIDLKNQINFKLGSNFNLDKYLKENIKKTISRYLTNFNLIG